jgi:AIPR protein/abortive infection phage resistance-like protein
MRLPLAYMPPDLDEFHAELLHDIHATADADGRYVEDAFFELFCSHLVDAGELETADRAFYNPRPQIRTDGYGGDPLTSENTLSLIIADCQLAPEVTTLTARDMDSLFKRLLNFLGQSLKKEFGKSLEETAPAFGLADLIAKRWPSIAKVRLFLISNRLLSARVDGRPEGTLEGVPVTYSVWDLGRLHRFVTSARGREDIEVDLENEFGGALLALPAHVEGADYQAYLTVIPGTQLARIYDRWGARLLEQNVRVFLQARGNVNRGIKTTLEHVPHMFLAYNNGITATAESISMRKAEGGVLLTSLRNLQIVNGGQTTASIHAASRVPSVDLSQVFVQMKISIIDPMLSDEIVPKISEYANSQNRVNSADFFANHPYHIRMQDFSRRVLAPSPDGTFRDSKWFYERARGQYQDAKGNLTGKARSKFDLDYPKRQVFSKTDLAKFMNTWLGQPHIVSRGAQKNFASFAETIGKEWERQPDSFNEVYFHELVAKAIVFRATEELVSEQSWYQGGYRANIVAYAIAKLAHDVAAMGKSVDFERIWREQKVSPGLLKALLVAATNVNEVITDTTGNVTEWAKQPACWTRVSELRITWPNVWLQELIGQDKVQANRRAAVQDQRMLNGIQAQTAVVNAGGDLWRSLRQWGTEERLISPTEAEILAVAASVPIKIPSEKQSLVVVAILQRLHAEGCQIGLDVLRGGS